MSEKRERRCSGLLFGNLFVVSCLRNRSAHETPATEVFELRARGLAVAFDASGHGKLPFRRREEFNREVGQPRRALALAMVATRAERAAARDYSVEQQMDELRQRLKKERQQSDREQEEMIRSMQKAMEAARSKLNDERNAARRQANFLRRCRHEADAARAAFEQDLKRRQDLFDSSDAYRARREAERERHAEEQRKRAEHVHYGDATFGGMSGAPLKVGLVATRQQEAAYAAFEQAFAAFEAAPPEEQNYGLADVPWPPQTCPVSGMRKGEAPELKKQRLKLALLRWHPDKFMTSHGGKLIEAEREAVIDKVNAILRRVQHERAAAASSEDAAASQASPAATTSSSTPQQPPSSSSSNATAYAAASPEPRHTVPPPPTWPPRPDPRETAFWERVRPTMPRPVQTPPVGMGRHAPAAARAARRVAEAHAASMAGKAEKIIRPSKQTRVQTPTGRSTEVPMAGSPQVPEGRRFYERYESRY